MLSMLHISSMKKNMFYTPKFEKLVFNDLHNQIASPTVSLYIIIIYILYIFFKSYRSYLL